MAREMNAADANSLDVDLYCATCVDRTGDLVPVHGTPKNGGFFVCPHSFTMSHYGPNGYAVDEHGIRYTYDDEGSIVVQSPSDPISKFIQWVRIRRYGTTL